MSRRSAIIAPTYRILRRTKLREPRRRGARLPPFLRCHSVGNDGPRSGRLNTVEDGLRHADHGASRLADPRERLIVRRPPLSDPEPCPPIVPRVEGDLAGPSQWREAGHKRIGGDDRRPISTKLRCGDLQGSIVSLCRFVRAPAPTSDRDVRSASVQPAHGKRQPGRAADRWPISLLAHWIGADRYGLATRSRRTEGSDMRVASRRGPVMYISRPTAFVQLSV